MERNVNIGRRDFSRDLVSAFATLYMSLLYSVAAPLGDVDYEQ